MVGKQEAKHSNAESSKQISWSSKEKNFYCPDTNGFGLHREISDGDGREDKPFRSTRADTEGTDRDRIFWDIFPRGESDQAALLRYIKKLVGRLELLEAESISLAEEQSRFINDHRDRLLKRLGENEEFARRSEETRQKLAQGRSALRQEIVELTRVLGASELESTTE
ncbi:hypothetical protein [Okeania sp. SIO2B3]|uniref:hypothetical protein n=1 Tax=Okeania sp. SIO2B3 TaxID=2607784 RepID=UPI0013BF7653|nr:hypothetical protein [Okeania sp. SIO2B3]NET44864.1 hypothetical protein [Okeania sp. SIO2B3]